MSGLPRRFLALCSALCVAMMAVAVRSQSSSLFPQSTLSVTKVKSTWMLTGYIIELEFSSGSPLPYVRYTTASMLVTKHAPVLPGGKVKFWSYDNQLTVNLLHSGGNHYLSLHVANNSVEQSASGVQMFLGGADADGDFFYYRGRDVDVSVTFRASGSHLDSLRLGKGPFVQKSRWVDNELDYTSGERFLERLQYNENDGERVMLLRVKGSSYFVEGLQFMSGEANFGCNGLNNCIVRRYTISAEIPVYPPSEHMGPFPTHFLAFTNGQGEFSERECQVDASNLCVIECFFYGNQPSQIQMERVDHDDDNQLNATGRLSLSNGVHWAHFAYGRLEFTMLEIGDTALYRCSSRSGPTTLSHTIRVTGVFRQWES